MAENTETITILKVGTEQAVQSIADLKNNIKELKRELETTQVDSEEGWKHYQETLEELKVNQNALKDAMYATTGTFADVTRAATGASESYNSLVHRMAALKEEFRATNDEARRDEIGKQIKAINDELKRLDEKQGNHQRNVGNYAESIKSAFADMSKQADAFGKSLGAVGSGVNGVKNGFDAFSKSPAIATIGIIVSLVAKLVAELKENENAVEGIKKGTEALKPIMDFFSGILDTIAEYLSEIITSVAKFISSNGIFQKIIGGVMGVGNAILQFVVSPFKAVIAAIKVFKEEGVKGFRNIGKAFKDEMEKGVSFKQNFQAGQAAADALIGGARSKKKKAEGAGKELADAFVDVFKDELEKQIQETDRAIEKDLDSWLKSLEDANKKANAAAERRLKDVDKAYAHQLELNNILIEDEDERAEKSYAIQEEANQRKLGLLDQFMAEAMDRGDLDAWLAYDQERADLEVEIETNAIREKERLRRQDIKAAEANVKAQKALLQNLAGATSAILGDIADLYEQDEAGAEKNAEKIKGLRIAAATIDTITGAIGAFMQAAATYPPPYGQIIGAISAAAVTAAGIVQIAKLKNTKVSGSSSSSSNLSAPVTSAPTLTTEVSNVRNVTSASEEDRLNQMASEQRVYILSSDIEASQKQVKTQVEESSF